MDESVFFFGNSIVNYTAGSFRSNVPYWMARFAQADNTEFQANGGFGFLRNFADRAEPDAEWSLQGVTPIYAPDQTQFADADITSIVISPANFLQEQSPTDDYFDGPRSPQDAVNNLIGDLQIDQPDAALFIYEPWPDMGFVSNTFPLTTAQTATYHALATGTYHDWHVEFTANINAAFPDADVTLIPVAPVLAELLTSAPLDGLTFDEIYLDSSPHGSETLYFLAATIVYTAVYGEVPPANYDVPDNIEPLVAQNFEAITARIADLMTTYSDSTVTTPPEDDTDTPDEQDQPPVDDDTPQPDLSEQVIGARQSITQELDLAAIGGGSGGGATAKTTQVLTVKDAGTYALEVASDSPSIVSIDDVAIAISTPGAPAVVDITLEPGTYSMQSEHIASAKAPDVQIRPKAELDAETPPLPLIDIEDLPEEDDDISEFGF